LAKHITNRIKDVGNRVKSLPTPGKGGRLTILSVFLALLVLGSIFVGFISGYSDVMHRYNQTIPEEMQELEEQGHGMIGGMENKSSELKGGMQENLSVDETGSTVFSSVKGSFGIVQGFLSVPGMVKASINTTSELLNIPSWITDVLMISLVTIISYLVLRMILGTRLR